MVRTAIGGLFGLCLAAAPATAVADDKPPETQALFETKCAVCHGKDGKPVPMFAKIGVRDLSDAGWQKARSDAQLKQVISAGSKGTVMRAFSEELKPEEIAALVGYVRSLKKAQPPK
jgi:mono/diheme cytochrome c family protein